ncbi:hypothetical protein [Rhodobacter ferrooxidans]|uniref:Uncharacterized protein n=1 Tax=Rhodobacter ferrooxidans TaxID=371731 RepID=C8S5H3_9RHOB|nr:hypothetical protein [Rhodobacter sp. SW2]EEW23786.1 hypothetical protein Rsw2DRAFT_3302 [Rhodobacter sp. SW2]
MTAPAAPFPDIQTRLDQMLAAPIAVADAVELAEQALRDGETVLEAWVTARGETPTDETVEGFRLLALHRQGAKGEPSFNACRETCRELVYLRNVVALYDDSAAEAEKHLRLQAMVLRHLALFVGGKMTESGLGDFCCSARPLHQPGAA